MVLMPFPFFLFRLFLFQDPLRRIRQHHDRTGQYRRIFITNRPAPDNNGKPNSPLPRLGTQTSGVVTKKDNVPNVMIIANPAPTKPIFGEKMPRKVKIPIAMIKIPKPREKPYVLFS